MSMGGGAQKQKSEAESGIQGAGTGITKATQMSPQEQAQYSGSFDIGNLLKQIMAYQMGMGSAPQGYQTGEQQYQAQGPLAQSYYQQTMAGTKDPYAAYESQLQPALQLTQDYINRGAQQRGLLRSGIPIEQMGRAGVDLAIKEAQDRMNFRGQELARGGELSSYTTGLGQQNLANMANLYSGQQSAGISRMGQQGAGAVSAAPYFAYPNLASLGDYYSKPSAQQGTMSGAMSGAQTGAQYGSMFGPWGTVIGGVGGAIGGGYQGYQTSRQV